MKIYTVYEVEVDPRSTKEEQFGGDMHTVFETTIRAKAISFAKKHSMRTKTTTGKMLYECFVERINHSTGMADFQQYFSSGNMTDDMGLQ